MTGTPRRAHFDYGLHWWAAAVASRHVVIDTAETRLPQRHGHHRYSVCGPNGVQQLTIPIKADTRTMTTPLHEVLISEHANWRRVHWGALYSAYGRSPYFDYVADELEAIFNGRQLRLLDFDRQVQELVTQFMQLPVTFDYLPLDQSAANCPTLLDTQNIHDVNYYQVWASRHGFVPNLSIFDLMMNQGPEGIFTLLKMAE
ncbi:MAG: WbqC family protein [Muribaculaceae bacterium]|nr:WbqC family protein [Muribaculaceae bacterium]